MFYILIEEKDIFGNTKMFLITVTLLDDVEQYDRGLCYAVRISINGVLKYQRGRW